MASLAKAELDALREKIAAIEKRPALAEGAAMVARRSGTHSAANDLRLGASELLSAPAGVLHELFTDGQRDSGIALGFALGLARGLINHERRALIYLQLASAAQELGLPYGIGLEPFGMSSDMLVVGRIQTLPELLWAMEEAIACPAVAGVIADIAGHPKALDFTASRRLSLRAAAAGTSAFLLRYGREREASAAKLRWHVAPYLSAPPPFDPLSPGLPRFRIEIEKRRLGSKTQRAEGKTMIVDWTENGFVSVEPLEQPGIRPARTAPLSGTLSPALGNRLSQAG